MRLEDSGNLKVLESTMQEENKAYCCEGLHYHTLHRAYLQGHDLVVCQEQQQMNLRIVGPTPEGGCPKRTVHLFLNGYASHGWHQMEAYDLFPGWEVAVFQPWGWMNGWGRPEYWMRSLCLHCLQRDHICSAFVTAGWWSLTRLLLLIEGWPGLHAMQVCPYDTRLSHKTRDSFVMRRAWKYMDLLNGSQVFLMEIHPTGCCRCSSSLFSSPGGTCGGACWLFGVLHVSLSHSVPKDVLMDTERAASPCQFPPARLCSQCPGGHSWTQTLWALRGFALKAKRKLQGYYSCAT